MALFYQDDPAGLPATVRAFDGAAREWLLSGLWADPDAYGGDACAAFLRASRALLAVVRRKGGTWDVGTVRYVEYRGGLMVAQRPDLIPVEVDEGMAA